MKLYLRLACALNRQKCKFVPGLLSMIVVAYSNNSVRIINVLISTCEQFFALCGGIVEALNCLVLFDFLKIHFHYSLCHFRFVQT